MDLHELLEAVVAVDDAAVEVVGVGGRVAAAVERDHRAQAGRNNREAREEHPLGAYVRADHTAEQGQALADLLAVGGRDFLLECRNIFFKRDEVEVLAELVDGFGADAGFEGCAVLDGEAVVLLFVEHGADADRAELLGRLEVQLLHLVLGLLVLERLHLYLEFGLELFVHRLEFFRIDGRDDESREVGYLLEIAGGNAEDLGETRRDAAEEPYVRDRHGEVHMAHALATNDGASELHAALLADDALEADAAIFTAVTFIIFFRTEDLLVEERVLLRALGAVVDGFRTSDFAVRPFADALRRGRSDADGVEVGRFGGTGLLLHVGLRRLAVLHEFDVERQTAQGVDEHVEGRRGVVVRDALAADDRIEGCRAADDVVGLNREHFAQGMRRAVTEERPHFHFAEALTAALCLAAERLLGDERVGADRAHVDLVLDHVVEFQDVHVADGDVLLERLAGAAVEEFHLAVLIETGGLEFTANFFFGCACECRTDGLIVKRVGGKTEVEFHDLTEVHTGRHAERSEDDVDRATVGGVRHIFLRQDAGDDALVAVAAGEFVANEHRAELRHFHVDLLNDAGFHRVTVLAGKDLHADDAAFLAVFEAQRRVFHIAGLVAEDGTEQALFRGELRLPFRRHFADENVAGADFGADADDAVLVEVAELGFRNVRNVVGGFLRPELGVAHVTDELLDVDRREFAVLHEALGDDDGVFVVGAGPGHERDEHVLTERELTAVGGGRVREQVARFDRLSDRNRRALVQHSEAVGADEVHQRIRNFFAFGVFEGDALAVGGSDNAVVSGEHEAAGIARGDALHAGADERRFRRDARYRLLLHVRTHQRTVGVVVLEERDHVGRHRERLGRTHFHVLHVTLGYTGRRLLETHFNHRQRNASFFVGLHRTVGDRFVFFFRGVEVHNFFRHFSVDNLRVRRFDHAELIDAGEGREAQYETDVRTFRGVDRADAAVVARVHVAHFEGGAFAGNAAGAERGKGTEAFDFRERVFLRHEH